MPANYYESVTAVSYTHLDVYKRQVHALCGMMGAAFERQPHRRAYIITSYDGFERAYGKRADKNRKLYNGMIKTYLYQYFK